MTTIKATCPRCGDVDLVPADVQVTVAAELGWSTYTFTCVGCTEAVCKAADEDVVALLSGAGVRVDHLEIPLEYLESRVLERTSAPMTRDDLLDFVLWLDGTQDIVMAAQQDA